MVILIYREEVIIITPYELLELISKQYDPAETIQMLNELMKEIDNSPSKYINRLSQELDEFAERYNLCPLCGSQLITNAHEENRGEYQGFNCTEKIYEVECSNMECTYTSM